MKKIFKAIKPFFANDEKYLHTALVACVIFPVIVLPFPFVIMAQNTFNSNHAFGLYRGNFSTSAACILASMFCFVLPIMIFFRMAYLADRKYNKNI
jgi:uncharacterized membrane protein